MTDSGGSTKPATDSSSPYYVNPNENLSQGLITLKLDGTNYHLWSRSMRIALKTKKKLGFIDGTLPMPEKTNADFEAWDQSNTSVIGWIINSLTSEISELVIDNDSAYDLWKELQEKFGEADSVRIAHLRSAIASCTQGSSMTGQAGAENAQGEAKAVDGASNLRLSPEDCTRLMALLQQSNFTASSASPSQHQANTAATYPSYFAGPSNSEDDWFCKRS
ncbi:hypothetical protein LINPERPRIM_LOCUS15356 [Linum perenne]